MGDAVGEVSKESAISQKQTLFCAGSWVSKESAFSQKRTSGPCTEGRYSGRWLQGARSGTLRKCLL